MKIKISILMLILISFTQWGCKDDDQPDPEPAVEERCVMTQSVIQGDTTNYFYNDQYQLTHTTGTANNVSYEYHDDGRILRSTRGNVISEFEYSDNLPSKISETENGQTTRTIKLEFEKGQLSKYEYVDPQDVVMTRTTLNYDDEGRLTSFERLEYDPVDDTLYPFFEVKNTMADGKINPFNDQLAVRLLHLEEPVALGKSNMVSADLYLFGNLIKAEVTHTYNEFDLPLISELIFDNPQFPSNTIYYTYDCPEK